MLRILGHRTEPPNPDYGEDLGFVVDPEKEEEWTQAFKERSSHYHAPLQPPTSDTVEEAAEVLMEDIQRTNQEVLSKRHPPHPRAAPWWNVDCASATQTLCDTTEPEQRKVAHARLKGTVRAAKRTWADDYIRKAQLWEVAKWRHGRKLTKVPSLQGAEGLVHTHEEVSSILSRRFFPQDPPIVDPSFADDPDPLPTRTLGQVDEEFIEPLIKKAAKHSAPGLSGHTWTLIKWVWKADPKRLTCLLQACLQAGHHPSRWKEAVVCVIPKPSRADYTLAKNFRPISLLECLGKLLEKVVAKLIYRDMANHDIVPTTQFGGRNASSTLDAGLTLLHDVQAAHQTGLRAGVLLFDIQGFFDNINHDRLTKIFTNLGFATELVSWCKSFLKDQTVRLKFNGQTSDPFDFEVGTPQGSPVSPVLSIIYTSPLLHKMRKWERSTLGMYIDDGAIFACGQEWKQIEDTMRKGYSECAEWLTRAGLNIEPDKTELLFFRKRGEKSDPPPYTHLPNYASQTYYRVPTAKTICYLGFFFDSRLSWAHHVDTVCNRARATLKALQLLGNSVRGLEQASWRLAYNAICLPVLTYGCQLWYMGKQVTLVKKLQTVQNEAVRVISGTFRTTPREPLHQLLTILPMNLCLDMLTQSTALRLYKAPDSSQLLRRLGPAWHTPTHNDHPLPTPDRTGMVTTLCTLAAKVPPGGPRITPYPALPPGAPLWGGQVALIPKQNEWDYPPISEEIKNDCHRGLSTNIYCEAVLSNRNRDDGRQLGAAAAMLYHKGRENGHVAKVFGEELTIADIWTRALTPALNTITAHLSNKPAQLQESFKILLPSNPALCRALDPSAHEEQAASLSHLEKLGELLTTHPNIDVTLQWLPKKIHFGGFRRAKQKALMRRRCGSTRGYAHSEDLETGVRRSGATDRRADGATTRALQLPLRLIPSFRRPRAFSARSDRPETRQECRAQVI